MNPLKLITNHLANPYSLPMQVLELVENLTQTDDWEFHFNQLEHAMMAAPQPDCPLTHEFIPGLYIRRIVMPKGVILTTRIHQTVHPYFINKGAVWVWTRNDGWDLYIRGHNGITVPGTRRLLYMQEETVWTTYHPNPGEERDPNKIVDQITISPASLGHLDDIPAERIAEIEKNAKPQ